MFASLFVGPRTRATCCRRSQPCSPWGCSAAGSSAREEREENILRRFKVTPAGALPILLVILTSGLVAYLVDSWVLERARLVVRAGRIAEVIEASAGTLPADLEIINGAGKTLLPGLIDTHVHLGASGFGDDDAEKEPEAQSLMRYLYCGVTAVRSVGDWLDCSLELRAKMESGRRSPKPPEK